MIKLVLTDLDDTLIRFGDSHASARTVEAIHAAQEAGVRFGPVTGRPPCSMGWMFPGHPECYATGAFSNGQVIDIDGKRVHVVGLTREVLERVEAAADEIGDVYLAVYSLDDDEDTSFVTTKHERLLACPPPTYGTKLTRVMSTLDCDYVKVNLQCAAACSRERIEEQRLELAKRVPELDFVFPSQTAKVIDICPQGWTKGSAALYMAQYLGIRPDEVAVFGDSENDLALMRAVPNSVAVANATPEVRACARWRVGSCAEGGVADALFDIAEAAVTGEMPRFMRSQS